MTIKYGKRKGLNGPMVFPNGRAIYFDPAEQKYWDPTTDFYLEDDEVNTLKSQLFSLISKPEVAV